MELGTRLDLNFFIGEAVCTELGPFFTFMFLVRFSLRATILSMIDGRTVTVPTLIGFRFNILKEP